MEVLFHFVFSLFKIAVLGIIYGAVIMNITRYYGKHWPGRWYNLILQRKEKFWFASSTIVSIVLLIFMFTHWGNHGFGDGARIPLHHGKSVEEINGTWAFIQPNGYEFEVLTVFEFAITNDFLIGRVEQGSKQKGNIAVWNLSNNEVEFVDSGSYKDYASKYNLPSYQAFKNFQEHYSDYWHGWRFWLLG